MRPSLADLRTPAPLLGLLAGALLWSLPATAQTPRTLLSKTVSVGGEAAALELEFDEGDPLSIALSEGEVRIDGETVGRFQSGDGLDAAWRNLLGFAVALDDGPLARTLVDWAPPEGLPENSADLAERIDRALESALLRETAAEAAPAPEAARAPESPSTLGDPVGLRSLVSLLDRTEALAGLSEALSDLALDDVRLAVGEDLLIGPGEDVDATILVVDGDLEVEGRVRRDVVVVDGDLRLAPDSRVDGDIRYVDGTIVDQGGVVAGEVVRVESVDRDMERRIRDELRAELRSEIREATRSARRSDRRTGIFGRTIGGIGGALGHIFTVLVVAIIGAVVLHFAGTNLDAVAETARRTPGRALIVGTAGGFLILPAFVLGILALVVSIVGIPALVLWVPLFPVAIILAVGLGYLAVFRNVGAWVARQRFPYLGWVRLTNPVTLVAGGALALASPAIGAELVGILPWTGALEVLLNVTAGLLSAGAALLGFGAVLLTRGGRRPEFFDDDLFGGWSWGPRGSRTAPDPSDADGDVWRDMESAARDPGADSRTSGGHDDGAADTGESPGPEGGSGSDGGDGGDGSDGGPTNERAGADESGASDDAGPDSDEDDRRPEGGEWYG